ncbi:hypothetical protein Tco_1261239 [Tanacetum coccineum]
MPTEMELTLEQTQQGVSYEVSVDPHGFEGYLKMVVESMHIPNDPSFFLTNKTEALQGEELGLMNPLSESSCNCYDNSFISDGANRYGARATGAAPGIPLVEPEEDLASP